MSEYSQQHQQEINLNSSVNQGVVPNLIQSSRPERGNFLDSEQQNEIQDQPQQAFQDELLDMFEQARRQEVLRQINQQYEDSQSRQQHQEVDEIINRKQERQQKNKRKKQQQQMKRLRHQNAMEFFKKIKANLLNNFKQNILEVNQIKRNAQNHIYKILSHFSKQIIQNLNNLKSIGPEKIKREQFISLVKKIFVQKYIQTEPESEIRYKTIQFLAIFIGIGFKVIRFIDLSQLELQSFYNLKFQDPKGKKKKMNKSLDLLRGKIQRKIAEESLTNKNYVNIQSYAFDPRKVNQSQNLRESDTQNSVQNSSFAFLNEQIKLLKRTFKRSYCQIYCPSQQNWKLFNMEILQFQQLPETKGKVLANRAIIGFYSIRILNFNERFQHLKNIRMFADLEIRDQTAEFCDKFQLVIKRRHRLGCKNLYKNLIKQSHYFKTTQIFTTFDKKLIEEARKKQQILARQHFPKSVKQMRLSEYYVVPSLVQKYMILRQGAQALPGLEFHEEKVYSKQNLLKVSSRMGWIDHFRMVKQGQMPVKTTQNKNKSTTKLYTYSQTEPFGLKFNKQGQFLLDQQYNSIYVPPVFQPPSGFILIPQNVDYICKKHKYKSARIVQGFDVAAMHIVPNNIGFLVEEKHFQQIMKLHAERQQKLRIKKQTRRQADAINRWKKLFKSIVITQQV